MATLDNIREPISNLGLDDIGTLADYNAQINSKNYSSAVSILDNNGVNNKGFRAAIFNTIKNKILELEVYLLSLNTDNRDTIVSINEPTAEEMEGKTFWIQPNLGGSEMGILRSVKNIFYEGGFHKTSEWQLATDVECTDGETVEEKLNGYKFVEMTQAEYDALETRGVKTIYMIVG